MENIEASDVPTRHVPKHILSGVMQVELIGVPYAGTEPAKQIVQVPIANAYMANLPA